MVLDSRSPDGFADFIDRKPFRASRHRLRFGGKAPTSLIDLTHEADENVVPATSDAVVVFFRRADCRIHHDLGSGWVDYPAFRGEIRLHPPHTAVPFRAEGPRHLLLVAFPITYVGSLLADEAPADDPFRASYEVSLCDRVIFDLAERMWIEAERPEPPSQLFIDGALQSIVGLLLRKAATVGGPAPVYRISDLRLRRVVDYIEAHLAADISLDDLAEIACLSPYHFSRSFKKMTGQSPCAYRLGRRIARASELLTATDLPLATIAYHCGFASQSHMTRVFTQHKGTPPGKLRRQRG